MMRPKSWQPLNLLVTIIVVLRLKLCAGSPRFAKSAGPLPSKSLKRFVEKRANCCVFAT